MTTRNVPLCIGHKDFLIEFFCAEQGGSSQPDATNNVTDLLLALQNICSSSHKTTTLPIPLIQQISNLFLSHQDLFGIFKKSVTKQSSRMDAEVYSSLLKYREALVRRSADN
jgi:hypothetical protein